MRRSQDRQYVLATWIDVRDVGLCLLTPHKPDDIFISHGDVVDYTLSEVLPELFVTVGFTLLYSESCVKQEHTL